jgi:putative ABC transport system ATP-binding protein
VIRLERIEKEYQIGDGSFLALKGIDLTVGKGEFLAITGASGSGKSTLLNILGLLDRPTRGAYILDGREVSSLDKAERAHHRNRFIGFVFQSFNLLARTSALENAELPLVYSNAEPAARRERARKSLADVGLSSRENHLPTQLSGGQQQRVAIARALVNEPVLLLADEPTGNLDTRTSEEIMDLLTRLNRERELTIVMITHEPSVAAYAGRTIVLRDGMIVA